LFWGNIALEIIRSNTLLLRKLFIGFALIISFSDFLYTTAVSLLQSKNEVPFLKTSLFSGCFTVVLAFIALKLCNMGVLGLILAPGIARMCYQNWKWPLEVIKDLKIKPNDISVTYREMLFKIKFFGARD
jgi:hypothetical protein